MDFSDIVLENFKAGEKEYSHGKSGLVELTGI